MDPDATDPPTLTAKDVAKVEALIDPATLSCGGRGLLEGTARTERWSFGKRSTAAVARYHLGMGWPTGILRRTCPVAEVAERCVTHDNPPPPLSPTEPTTTPTETTAATPSSIGPVFRVCPPSWETTTAPIPGCP